MKSGMNSIMMQFDPAVKMRISSRYIILWSKE